MRLIIKNEDQYKLMLAAVSPTIIIAYDTETTGLNTRKDKIVGISISVSEEESYYLPTAKWDGERLVTLFNPERLLKALVGKKLIMFNASFDCRMTTSNFKIDLTNSVYADAMLLKHTVDEERPFDLKGIAKNIASYIGFDAESAANQEQLELRAHLAEIGASMTRDKYEMYKADVEILGKYACADTELTLKVFNYYSKILEEQGLVKFFYEDEVMPLYREVTIPMESKGVPVDIPAVTIAERDISADIKVLSDKIMREIKPLVKDFEKDYFKKQYPEKQSINSKFMKSLIEILDPPLPKNKEGKFTLAKGKIADMPDCLTKRWLLGQERLASDLRLQIQQNIEKSDVFSLTSKDHLAFLFFKTLKLKPISFTAKGNKPQVDIKLLTAVAKDYAWVEDLISFNKLNKLKSGYIDRIIRESEEGIYYPSYQQHRTISGRYGSDLQQLPRPLEAGQANEVVTKHTNSIRKFFISGENYVFIDNDYESLEPHVFSHVSGDEKLRDIFRTGHDFYSSIAIPTENLKGVSADKKSETYLGKVDKPRRQKAKVYALGIPYGMGAFKLKFELNVSQEKAEHLVSSYLKRFPDLHAWMQRSEDKVLTEGFVQSEAGRIRHMPAAVEIYDKFGDCILCDLELWKHFHPQGKQGPKIDGYEDAKKERRKLKNFLNNAKNFQIQSLGASIVNQAAIKINRYIKANGINGYVCAQVHDQLIVRVEEQYSEQLTKAVQDIMENNYKISVPLKAPPQIGKDFYEAH